MTVLCRSHAVIIQTCILHGTFKVGSTNFENVPCEGETYNLVHSFDAKTIRTKNRGKHRVIYEGGGECGLKCESKDSALNPAGIFQWCIFPPSFCHSWKLKIPYKCINVRKLIPKNKSHVLFHIAVPKWVTYAMDTMYGNVPRNGDVLHARKIKTELIY
jgi:hypothetical protein